MANYILSHSAQEIDDLLSSIPDKISQDILNNYYLKTQTYSKTEVNDLLASFSGLEFKIVDNISQVTESKYLYFIPASTSGTDNIYDEYLFIDGNAEYIGSYSSQIDLSNYITSGQLSSALSAYVTSSAFNTAISNLAIDLSNCVVFEKISDVEYDINI